MLAGKGSLGFSGPCYANRKRILGFFRALPCWQERVPWVVTANCTPGQGGVCSMLITMAVGTQHRHTAGKRHTMEQSGGAYSSGLC